MIMELAFVSGSVGRWVLPPCNLPYGFFGLLHKMIGLLWSLCLVLGPNPDKFKWFCSKVTSFTTDLGTEFGITNVPNLLPTFLRYNVGVPMAVASAFCTEGSKLFPKSIRLPGWGHTFGNLMKGAMKQFPSWPILVEHFRSICKAFRNPPWLDHLCSLRPRSAALAQA